MKKNHCLLLLCIVGFLYSCNDKEENVEFPIKLDAVQIVMNGDARIFIGGKERTDRKLIEEYTNSELESAFFNIDKKGKSIEGWMSFESPDNVTFSSPTGKYTVLKEDNQFLFLSQLPFPSETGTFPDIIKYRVPRPGPSGGYLANEIRVGYGSYSHIEMSFMAYKYSYAHSFPGIEGTSEGMRAGTLFNEFNGNFSFLQERDTLAIQEYKIIYSK